MTIIYNKNDFNNHNINITLDNQILDNISEIIKIIDLNLKNISNNNWRPQPKFKKTNLSQLEKYNNEINSLLNKISSKTYDKIVNNIIMYYNTNNNDLEQLLLFTINNIFNKAVIQPNYCPLYVKFIKKINNDYNIKGQLEEKYTEYKETILKDKKKQNEKMNDKEK